MRVRGRVWRVGKWVGLSSSFVVAMGWVVGQFWFFGYRSKTGSELGLGNGKVRVVDLVGPAGELSKFLNWSGASMEAGWWHARRPNSLARSTRTSRWTFFFETYPLGRAYPRSSRRLFTIPLWIPFVLVAVPTAFLWYRDLRRIPTGNCQRCGYDLNRNESGRCPECGRIVDCGLRNADGEVGRTENSGRMSQ